MLPCLRSRGSVPTRVLLRQVRGLTEGALRRHADAILAAVSEGAQAPPVPPDAVERPPAEAEPLTAIGDALVRARAHEVGIAPQLIANRAELTRVAVAALRGMDADPTGVLEGWRREVVGADLAELLRGRLSLSVAGDGRVKIRKEPP